MLNLEIFSQIKQSNENLEVIEDTISLSFENLELEQHINIIKNELQQAIGIADYLNSNENIDDVTKEVLNKYMQNFQELECSFENILSSIKDGVVKFIKWIIAKIKAFLKWVWGLIKRIFGIKDKNDKTEKIMDKISKDYVVVLMKKQKAMENEFNTYVRKVKSDPNSPSIFTQSMEDIKNAIRAGEDVKIIDVIGIPKDIEKYNDFINKSIKIYEKMTNRFNSQKDIEKQLGILQNMCEVLNGILITNSMDMGVTFLGFVAFKKYSSDDILTKITNEFKKIKGQTNYYSVFEILDSFDLNDKLIPKIKLSKTLKFLSKIDIKSLNESGLDFLMSTMITNLEKSKDDLMQLSTKDIDEISKMMDTSSSEEIINKMQQTKEKIKASVTEYKNMFAKFYTEFFGIEVADYNKLSVKEFITDEVGSEITSEQEAALSKIKTAMNKPLNRTLSLAKDIDAINLKTMEDISEKISNLNISEQEQAKIATIANSLTVALYEYWIPIQQALNVLLAIQNKINELYDNEIFPQLKKRLSYFNWEISYIKNKLEFKFKEFNK